MSASASVNVGNRTESTVTNETVNESNFTVTNCTSIVNTLNQETVLLVNSEVGTIQNVMSQAKLTIKGTTIEIGGKNNKVKLTANSSAKVKAEVIAKCQGQAKHSASAQDAVAYDITTNGESMQFSEMISSAKATQTTECSSSGLLSLSMSVGVNNSVVSNVNNSIKNIFNMAISNYMSSETRRNMLVKNVTQATAIANQAAQSEAVLEVLDSTFKLTGENGELTADATTGVSSESSIMSEVDSSASALTSAISTTTMSTTSDITNSQTAISKADASADGSTKVSSDSGLTGNTLVLLAIVGGVVGVLTVGVTMWAKVKMCQRVGYAPVPTVVNNDNNAERR